LERAFLDAEAMENGRGTMEEASVGKKCGGYGEEGGESLEGG